MEQEQSHHLTPEDWQSIAREPDFRDLLVRRRRFIIPATMFFLAYFFALPVLVAFAPAFMSRQTFWHLTYAYVFALSQFVMTWTVMVLYLLQARANDLIEAHIVHRVKNRYRV